MALSLFNSARVAGVHTREASVWEACCWHSGVIKHVLNCFMVLMAVVVIMVVFMLVLDWLIPTRLDRHLTQRGVVLAEALRRGLKRPRHAAMSRQQLKERKYLQRLMGPIAGLFYLAD